MTRTKKTVDSTTEEKIREAARKVFTTKGYAGARTRDIAEMAGINLALLNYYFRSKEKLFELIMLETLQHFIKGVKEVLMDDTTTLKEKTEHIATTYIDMLLQNPDLPVFILSELRSRPEQLVERMNVKEVFGKSVYLKQLKEAARSENINPIHYFMNTMAMIVFPFVGRPLLTSVAGLKDQEFTKLMQERKKLIARWIEAILKVK